MTAKRTASPWKVTSLGGGSFLVESHTHPATESVDEAGNPCEWAEQTEATARLISAAPYLMELAAVYMTYFEMFYVTNTKVGRDVDATGKLATLASSALDIANGQVH